MGEILASGDLEGSWQTSGRCFCLRSEDWAGSLGQVFTLSLGSVASKFEGIQMHSPILLATHLLSSDAVPGPGSQEDI